MASAVRGKRVFDENCVRDQEGACANDRLPVDTSDALASGFLAADFAGYLPGCLARPCAIGGGTTADGDQFHWDEAGRLAAARNSCPVTAGTGARGDRWPHAVGEKRPNAWGLYDMYGNVWEWCLDWHAAAYYQVSPPQDPIRPIQGDTRVLRGGGWASGTARCRSASRVGDLPLVGDPDTGFCVLLLKPGKPPCSSL